ncbi:hypothetical protein HYPBUDRAFT_147398 [Hyphopichia burtonii NRRL Y-1933]|uniref:Large ribosomal subunit protein mL43 n=1 Tax=Hyphopichia burtonii NRRL Y-1933 TaxID=984485 RepID=A0A1E4RNQ4_9ASCO|nr:hypothetical protein HYPBUDRAFT_147398 [Hyphopichia burtonii NRRL Y-1933]ODV68866.1 hypothetical protein HYPBUDRAFT_147398 [Hyphopichia burtonii NRRL Y-1933]
MPVKAIPKTSLARNGVGAFVVPCHRVTVQYCNWGGSSNGVRELLKSGKLNKVASTKPQIVFDIVKRSGHPQLKFHYNNDVVKDVDVRNLKDSEVLKKLHEHSQSSGNPLYKYNHKVKSVNESVRGIWSPLHVFKENRHKI